MTIFLCSWITLLVVSIALITLPKRHRKISRTASSSEYRRIRTRMADRRRFTYADGVRYNPLPWSRRDRR